MEGKYLGKIRADSLTPSTKPPNSDVAKNKRIRLPKKEKEELKKKEKEIQKIQKIRKEQENHEKILETDIRKRSVSELTKSIFLLQQEINLTKQLNKTHGLTVEQLKRLDDVRTIRNRLKKEKGKRLEQQKKQKQTDQDDSMSKYVQGLLGI